jgi:hypothetical protein
MTRHAFIDESFRKDYLVCAVIVESRHVAGARQDAVRLLRRGQSRVHMVKENTANRRAILRRVSEMSVIANVVTVSVTNRSQRTARDLCLRQLVCELLEAGVTRLVIESCDQDRRDLQVIGDALATEGKTSAFEIQHLRPHDEPMLWLPDVIAWALGNTEQWRKLIMSVIAHETRL